MSEHLLSSIESRLGSRLPVNMDRIILFHRMEIFIFKEELLKIRFNRFSFFYFHKGLCIRVLLVTSARERSAKSNFSNPKYLRDLLSVIVCHHQIPGTENNKIVN